jgi:hypothetical protein
MPLATGRVGLFLDFNGTLVRIQPDPAAPKLNPDAGASRIQAGRQARLAAGGGVGNATRLRRIWLLSAGDLQPAFQTGNTFAVQARGAAAFGRSFRGC